LLVCLLFCKAATVTPVTLPGSWKRVPRRYIFAVKFLAQIERHSQARNGHWTPGIDHARMCDLLYDSAVDTGSLLIGTNLYQKFCTNLLSYVGETLIALPIQDGNLFSFKHNLKT